jgi:hypothetical protein
MRLLFGIVVVAMIAALFIKAVPSMLKLVLIFFAIGILFGLLR